jgi:serine/threonine protein kinase
VMIPGEPVELDESNMITWTTCVHRDLAVIHSAKYCHCDIRPSNVLKFGDTFHLIDFDLSVPIGGTVVFSEGGQFDYRPTSFLTVSCGEDVTWDEKHDYAMVTMVIAKKALFLGKNRTR